jgi:hypothetical protein
MGDYAVARANIAAAGNSDADAGRIVYAITTDYDAFSAGGR